ncbi:hypothetical protein [Bradyrhizobium stylosanthis]|uniref:hypothetical protein n=1 Tax=Bradyrhizobium stylosanthis TaxID=1803665 RepID=UPI0012E8009D|nr:hypothetical protein [Bradyrhizobium stylosanthis]
MLRRSQIAITRSCGVLAFSGPDHLAFRSHRKDDWNLCSLWYFANLATRVDSMLGMILLMAAIGTVLVGAVIVFLEWRALVGYWRALK